VAIIAWRAALSAALVVTPGGGGGDAPAAAAPGFAAEGRFVDGTYTGPAGTRRWRLWVPNGYDASRAAPLLVLLHGCTQDPDDLVRGTRIAMHADRLGVLVLLPEQPASANIKKCWNWFDPAHQRRDAGEPSLIAGMTRQVAREWSADQRRVYVAGISAGAAMASIMAIGYPDLFAAAGLHSGIPFGAATDVMQGVGAMANGAADTDRLARAAHDAMGPHARPLPAIIIQGAADAVVRPINATHTRDLWSAMNALALGDAKGAKGAPATSTKSTAEAGGLSYSRERLRAAQGTTNAEIVVITVEGLGHAWSGGSSLGTFTDERGPDATAEMLDFLLAHAMPAAASAPNARP
jgi:poly(hydroxyalkanoate) depolymerase family esterase